MPVNIQAMTSDVTVLDADMPLSQQQIDKLVTIVLRRLEEKQREAEQAREATALRRHSAPLRPLGE
jgi:hypothetical protein